MFRFGHVLFHVSRTGICRSFTYRGGTFTKTFTRQQMNQEMAAERWAVSFFVVDTKANCIRPRTAAKQWLSKDEAAGSFSSIFRLGKSDGFFWFLSDCSRWKTFMHARCMQGKVARLDMRPQKSLESFWLALMTFIDKKLVSNRLDREVKSWESATTPISLAQRGSNVFEVLGYGKNSPSSCREQLLISPPRWINFAWWKWRCTPELQHHHWCFLSKGWILLLRIWDGTERRVSTLCQHLVST